VSITSNHLFRRRLRTALIAACVVALGARFVYSGVRPNISPKRFGVVEAGRVYRSGQLTPAAFESVIKEHGIRTVIDLGSTIHGNTAGEARNQRTADSLGVKRYVFRLFGDATGNPNAYIQALRLAADPAHQPVLVHCGAGTERTGLFCILYKHLHLGTPLEEGFTEATTYGHNPRRTPQMRQMMDTWSGPILEHARQGGQIDTAEFDPLPDPVPGP
jgi:protein tyrosine/serine phosphatase